MSTFKLLLLLLANFIILATAFVLTKNLLLTFNRQLFYTLVDVWAHISNYPKNKEYIFLYINIVEQTVKIFNLKSIFTDDLIKVLKKNKTFVITQ